MTRRAYIAGPMTGYPEWNFPAFKEAREYVRAQGWEAVCPAEHDLEMGFTPDMKTLPNNWTREDALRWDIGVLIDPETTDIVLLPGWKTSAGAVELAVAIAVGLKINLYNSPLGRLAEVPPDSAWLEWRKGYGGRL